MKKIINGARYAPTAKTLLAIFTENADNPSDSLTEELHRKQTGEYFIYGRGGSHTRFAQNAGNSMQESGESIIPLTEDDARAWVKAHCEGDYQRIFRETPDEAIAQLSVSITVGEIKRLKKYAEKKGIAQVDAVRQWIAGLE